tara:strand:+ start:528 stop:767 length:240 start_codon:yes stop_codon:yes gene_type:complete
MSPINNPAEDFYDPPGVGTEFDPLSFGDVEMDDLLWLKNNTTNGSINHAHRKIDENTAHNIQTGDMVNIQHRTTVFQKT